MAYTPTVWNNGDVVTAAKLNKLENGVRDASESNVMIVKCSQVTNSGISKLVAGKSYNEIETAMKNGILVYFAWDEWPNYEMYASMCLVTSYRGGAVLCADPLDQTQTAIWGSASDDDGPSYQIPETKSAR